MLYSKYIASIPLFRGLSPAVVRALCAVVEPTFAIKRQVRRRGGQNISHDPCTLTRVHECA